MKKDINIPVIEPNGMDSFHFSGVSWPFNVSKDHNLFHINRIENYRDKLSFPLPPHRKTVYDLIFLTKGSSIRSKGLANYEFGVGQFFFLPPYQITSHEFMSKDAQGYFVHFDIDILKHYSLDKHLNKFNFLNFLSNPVVSVSTEAVDPILNIFHRLEVLDQETENKQMELIAFYVFALLKEASLFAGNDLKPQKNAAASLVQRYKEALSQFIYQKQKVSDYADYLHVTPNHLNKCVKSITMKSSQDLLNEMMILEAKSLLKYSNLHIAEIAIKLGNQTPSNFARFFKSKTGMMPKEYK
ncbi:helix-turn-helix domain-containing protein [Lacihabitans soyangensis]|uniref:AraC family transcriptional regulator n=1 Tax=Lacihabitans soyangensis TaxID=869394 RepID=A0AAE3KQV2_9BACT|nr:helix-turn-helix transcriptional regulator [Lacihabitans soyangensis]MCP9761542.1 AraC family transcriptional regulator [Lacihabitans soyangensis]